MLFLSIQLIFIYFHLRSCVCFVCTLRAPTNESIASFKSTLSISYNWRMRRPVVRKIEKQSIKKRDSRYLMHFKQRFEPRGWVRGERFPLDWWKTREKAPFNGSTILYISQSAMFLVMFFHPLKIKKGKI